jgi:hypothetical protein
LCVGLLKTSSSLARFLFIDFIAAITYADGAMAEENIASLLHDEFA